MLKNFFKKNKEEEYYNYNNIMIAALLVHAARMDENYTEVERKIITRALIDLTNLPKENIEKIISLAEKKELESNQIIEFTKEIKKNAIEFRFKIIELLWRIIYSDGVADQYEKNLIRRVCGLLYISDKDNGIIKLKVQKEIK